MTTLSHFELVSWRVDGSSSSQSANLLMAPSQPTKRNENWVIAPVEFLRLLNNLLLVLTVALGWSFLLRLVAKIRNGNLHLSGRCWPA